MRTLLILLASALLAGAVCGEPLSPDPQVGARPGAFSARSLSLGHTFVISQSGAAALTGNPATLAAQNTQFRFEGGADLTRIKEVRKYPFYDAFDGVLGYNNYAVNDNLFSKFNCGLSWSMPNEMLKSLVLAVGSFSAYNFDYRYLEEVRDRYSSGGIQDRRLGQNRLSVSGDLRSFSVGAAAQMHGPLALGFSWNGLFGDWVYVKGTYYDDIYLNPDSNNIVNRVRYRPDGVPSELAVGGTYEVNPRVTVGARALLPAGDFKFKQTGTLRTGITETTAEGTVTVSYPAHYAVGVQYRPQSEFRPLLLLEGEVHTYSRVSDVYDDTFEIRAGAEQEIVPGAPARVGFVYATSPEDKNRAGSIFTAGIGFHQGRFSQDVGIEFGRINYISPDLFPQSLFGDTDRLDSDRVEVAQFRLLLTLKYEL
ncbi:MAG: hypothetical protein NT025_04520 [bacterium]|nr:hypothetical protein [bacterium]